MQTTRTCGARLLSQAGLVLVMCLFPVMGVCAGAPAPAGAFSSSTDARGAGEAEAAAAPDLVVESIAFSPNNPGIGQPVDITITVKNRGDMTATGIRLHVYVDPIDEPPVATTPHTAQTFYGLPLGSGAVFSYVRAGQSFASGGMHKVYAWVDRDNTISESNEANNQYGPALIPVGPITNPDAFEPDNDCAQSRDIATDGSQQSHTLSPVGDVDWVKFAGVSGWQYHVKGIADGVDADLTFELYSACPGTAGTGQGAELIFVAPVNGMYYVKMRHTQPTHGLNTDYRVQVTVEYTCSGSFEPNDVCTDAGDIPANNVAQVHDFCRPGDVDWVKLPTVAGISYAIGAANVGPEANLKLSLFPACDADSSVSIDGSLVYTAPTTGYAYLRAENVPTTTAGANTAYKLQAGALNTGCAPDAYEADNSPSVASNVALDIVQAGHNACPAGDVDWAAFQAVQGVEFTIHTLNLGPHADTVLCLYDSSGSSQLLCDDDGGPGAGSRLVWRAPSSGTYYLKIRGFDSQVAGPETRYDLLVSAMRCQADAFEDDDAIARARAISPGAAAQVHAMCSAAGEPDEDWVSFPAVAGPYFAQADGVGAEADAVLELYDSAHTRLEANDDFDTGTSARIAYTFTAPGTYYLRARHFNPTAYGFGTEYSLSVMPGQAPPVPPNTPASPGITKPPPRISGARTLILVNLSRFEAVYGAEQTSALSARLDALSAHPQVGGDVLRVEDSPDVAAAYAGWLADATSPVKANLVSAAIRRVVLNYLASHDGVQYVVLVGGDDMLPLRRVADNTPRIDLLEKDYAGVSAANPTGAALHANHYLTDDYYADRDPTPFENRELYIPDLAIGRLIETPGDITAFIDAFLANPTKVAGRVLVTGYDFVDDASELVCANWRQDIGDAGVDCSLIGRSWPLIAFKTLQLSTPFDVQSINGHAVHYAEGAPGQGNSIAAQEIIAASADFVGDLIYSMGCHSGLNAHSSEPSNALDLPEAFARRGANYVGNTGFGWGLRGAIGLSETMIGLFSEELRRDSATTMGAALARAKQRYHQQVSRFTGYDEKVMEELVFYGLPMYRLQTGATLGGLDDPFPSVDLLAPEPGGNLGDQVVSGTLALSLRRPLTLGGGSDGFVYYVDGSASANAGAPQQPLFYGTLGESQIVGLARSVVFLGGSFATVSQFDPVIATPHNEYVAQPAEAGLDRTGAWYPDTIVDVRRAGNTAGLAVQLGQYQALGGEQRIFSNLNADVYYSSAADEVAPRVTVVDALFDPQQNSVLVKVGAVDASGIRRVIVSYIESSGDTGTWKSTDLRYDSSSQKWKGAFPGNASTRYFAQVVDGAGNAASATNKALYYTPAMSRNMPIEIIRYLPTMFR